MGKFYATATGLCCLVLTTTVFGQYDPPAGYYSTATGTGLTLKNQLHNIIDNHVVRSYDAARQALQILDEDPNNSSRVILVYSGESVPGTWDSGVTWNREHQWPRSLGVGTSGPDNSDLFQLRSCDPGINSSRGNKPYGIGGAYWDPAGVALPGVNDRGDCSRAIFYMAVRYDGSDSNTEDLEIVNGLPGTNQMGDLARMLEWHYADPVTDAERRRNHYCWSSALNPLYFQGNRNPFIDHPEYVWTIFGTTPNDSTLYAGAGPDADGGSTVLVSPRVITGVALPSQAVTLHKTGSTPTTYNVTVSGDVESSMEGTGMAFTGGTGSVVVDVSFGGASAIGTYIGTITIDNTDLTSAGAGEGAGDNDDVIDVEGVVLDHAEGSLSGAIDTDSLTLDFGTVAPGSGPHELAFDIYNLLSPAGPTADLIADTVEITGDTDVFSTDLLPFVGLAPGSSQGALALMDASVPPGIYEAQVFVSVSDEEIPGAEAGAPLVLTLVGEVAGVPVVPAVSTWGMCVMLMSSLAGGTILFRRRSAVERA